MEGMCEEKRADDKTFKERVKVANLPCHHRRSRLTLDPPPVAVLFWPPMKSLAFSHWHLLRKYPAAHCTLISKSNKPVRLNCMSQPGVCGKVIVLTGCRWTPAPPHKADHGRDIKGWWPHDNRRGVTGWCLNVKKERERERKEGRKEGRKTPKPLRRFPHSRCYYSLSLCLLTSVSLFKLDLYLCLTIYKTLCCSRGSTFSCYEKKNHTWAHQRVIFSGDGSMRSWFTNHGTLQR